MSHYGRTTGAHGHTAVRWCLLLVVCSLAYYGAYAARLPFAFGDEGYLLYIARGITLDRLPYRDVDLFAYPAGLFYAFSLVFRWCGDGILAPRLLMALGLSVSGVLTFLVARRLVPLPYALALAVLRILMPGPWHKFYVALLNLGVLYAILRYRSERRLVWLALGGFLVGLAFHVRVDAAIVGLGLIALGVGFDAYAAAERPAVAVFVRRGLFAGACVVLAAAPMVLYLWSEGVLGGYAEQLLRFLGLAADRSWSPGGLRLPPLAMVFGFGNEYARARVLYASILIVAVYAFMCVDRGRRRAGNGAAQRDCEGRVLVAWVAVANLPQYALARAGNANVLQQSFAFQLPLIVLMAAAVCGVRHRSGARRAAAVLVLLALLGFSGEFVKAYGLRRAGSSLAVASHRNVRHVTLSNGMTYWAGRERTFAAMMEHVLAHTTPDDTVATLPFLPGFNFMVHRRMPGRHVYVVPHSVRRSRNVEAEYIRALETTGTPYIVAALARRTNRTAGSALRDFAPALDAYIRARYVPIMSAGQYVLFERLARPAALGTVNAGLDEAHEVG